jgi:CheY-like chemotaxis protein
MPAQTRGRVLVVDDEPDAALTLCTLLSLGGYASRACHDGPTALALAEKLRPTACVLDIRMPGMDGYELARRLRGMFGS